MKLISLDAVITEIERRIKLFTNEKSQEGASQIDKLSLGGRIAELQEVKVFLDTLEVKDPYEQCVQYPSVKDAIQAHAETYSFNIESLLFNQLTKEQQKLWRKEIEQACISGGKAGVELARDIRYKENLEVKEVDLEAELNKWRHNHFHGRRDKDASGEYLERISQLELAKHFFELGIEKFVDESIIRKIVDLNNEAAKHYDAIMKKERNENGFSQLAIDLLDHNVDANELRIQYIIENLKAQKGE